MVEEIPTGKFRAILEELDGDLRLLNIYAITKLYLDGKQTEASVRLFRYASGAPQTGRQAVNWAALKENHRGKPELFIQCTTVDTDFVAISTNAVMDTIYPIVHEHSTIEVVTATEIADVVHMYFDEKGTHPHRPLNEPNYYYYASDDAAERLKSETVTLPEGFEFFNLGPEHAVEAAKVMPHADEGEADIIRLQLSTLPGVGIRCVETGELAAFEYTNGFGFITNLYTLPKFRHRGLGTAVERRVSQRIAKELGLRPAKNVSLNRPRVVRMTEANGLWTALVNGENGEKHVMRWNFFCKEPRPPVIVHEN